VRNFLKANGTFKLDLYAMHMIKFEIENDKVLVIKFIDPFGNLFRSCDGGDAIKSDNSIRLIIAMGCSLEPEHE
jgi:hypothetical protein